MSSKDAPPAKSVAGQRRGQSRRRDNSDRRPGDPAVAEEKTVSDEEVLFTTAIEQYKRANRRPFPTWSEVLEVLHALGYRKAAPPAALPVCPATST
jgi:hypothetical protein